MFDALAMIRTTHRGMYTMQCEHCDEKAVLTVSVKHSEFDMCIKHALGMMQRCLTDATHDCYGSEIEQPYVEVSQTVHDA